MSTSQWCHVQTFKEYVDFEKSILNVEDEADTSLDLKLVFNTQNRTAYLSLAWRCNNAESDGIETERSIEWSDAIRLLGNEVRMPKELLA